MRVGNEAWFLGIPVLVMMMVAPAAAMQEATDSDTAAVQGAEMAVEVAIGDCDEGALNESVVVLAPFAEPSGERVGSERATPAVASISRMVPLSLAQLAARPHVMVVRATDARDEAPQACGELAGALTAGGELIVGLGEQNDSGVTGIAHVSPDQADTSRISTSVFLAHTVTAARAEETRAAFDPRGYWRLDETSGPTAADATGSGFDGIYGDGVALGANGAEPAGATPVARFDGSGNAAVDMGDVLDFPGQTPFSLEAWIAPTKLPAGAFPRIVQKEGADADRLRQGYVLVLIGDSGQVGFERWRDGAKEAAVSPCPLPTDTPVHVVATYDGEIMRLFVNGIQVASAPSTENLVDTPSPFRVGNSSEGTSPFEGGIADIAVYDVALDPESVIARYESGRDARSWPGGPLSADVSCP